MFDETEKHEPPKEAGLETAAGGVELLHGLSESIFGAVAATMVAHGWSVFPQENAGDRRLPGRVHGRLIRWMEDHDLAHRRPDAATLELWAAQCDGLNVACVFGPASGHTFAVDIDVTDAAMSAAIVELAEEILGPTPFMRVGRAPKIALIYRHGADEAQVIPSTARRFADIAEDGTAARSEHGLEILGAGKLLTFHGHHHKTGRYFRWIGGATPLLDGPDKAPLVTPEMVQTFLEAVDSRFRFHRGSSFDAAAVTWQWDESTKLRVPRLALAAGGSAWQEDADGFISDGREAYLVHLVYRFVTSNPERLAMAIESGRDGLQKFKASIAAAVEETFKRTTRLTARWSGASLLREIRGKVSHLVDKFATGRMPMPNAPAGGGAQDGRPRESTAALALPPDLGHADHDLSFLVPASKRDRQALKGDLIPPPAGQEPLAIEQNRDRIAGMVQTGLKAAFRSFFADVYGAEEGRGGDQKNRVHIIKAPTGAGKTSLCIRAIAEDPRTYEDHEWTDPETGQRVFGRAPFVMLLPTYNNIDELRTRASVIGLDGTLPDDELLAQAEAMGLIAEHDEAARLSELRRDALGLGLRTMVYSGKIRAGCRIPDKVKMLMAAGMGTAALCRAKVRKDDRGDGGKPGRGRSGEGGKAEYEEVFCPHYDSCPAMAQRADIQTMHIVFMPHSFLSLSIPDELTRVRAVIADERIHHLFLHTGTFSAGSLMIARKPPRLTKKERDEGTNPADFLSDRDRAASIALDALQFGACPAAALFSYTADGAAGPAAGQGAHGLGLVKSALRVCGDAIKRDGSVSPQTPIEDLEDICSRPTGRDIREEWRFWKIIEERIEALRADSLRDEVRRAIEDELSSFQGQWDVDQRMRKEKSLARIRAIPTRARGERDFRIQLLTDASSNGGTTESIRISWRTTPNWAGVPMLLLDASAAPSIIAKIWNLKESDIVLHNIVEDTGRALNVKIVAVVNQTFSNSSVAASASASDYERLVAARNLDNVRQALATVSALYGHSRVVAGTSIILREVINRDWVCPDNIDWCHFGAMRGLDMFKFHAAAISVGRMEPPIRTIDGLVAALTYDDEVPEPPYDHRGDGRNHANPANPLLLPSGEQRVRLRSGHVAVLKVPVFPGQWGRLVQKQYREEELLQFVGRLRPVYRQGAAPVWFALSSVIPDELIVDDIIHIDTLVKTGANLWEAVRQNEGIAEPELLARRCPGAFGNAARSARTAMERMGFNFTDGTPKKRAAEGFAALRWHHADGRPGGMAFVRAGLADPETRLRAAMAAHLAVTVGLVERVWAPESGLGAMARTRAPDTVDERIGSRAGRREREAACLDIVGELALNTEGPVERSLDSVAPTFPLPLSSGGVRNVSVRTAGAYVGLTRFWRETSGVADDRLMPMPSEDSAPVTEGEDLPASYAHLGATVADDAYCDAA